ncbi:MAG TPA: hypothetical protein VGP47_03505 [Parachlamydiaceae bacterium]|nr:hypothetical protein [Parachlamydiaceae bacterium]
MNTAIQMKSSSNILPFQKTDVPAHQLLIEKLESGTQKIKEFYEFAPTINEVAWSILRVFVVHNINGGIFKWTGIAEYASFCNPIISLGWALSAEIYPMCVRYQFNKLTADQTHKTTLLVCRAAFDFNGAIFRGIPKNIEALTELSTTLSIFERRVDRLDQINEDIDTITEQGRNIRFFWLCMHGTSEEMLLGSDKLVIESKLEKSSICALLISNKKSIERIHFSKLDPDAFIILDSCNTGEELPYPQMNIAEYVQYYAGPKRKVYAPIMKTEGAIIDSKMNVRFGEGTANISYEVVAEKYKLLQKATHIQM